MRFEDFFWHDSQILSWTIDSSDNQSPTGSIELRLASWEDMQAADRFLVTVRFENVEKKLLNCDFASLADHFSFGNIDWASMKGGRTFKFDLFGENSFEVVADSVSITRDI
jgi:hypothetical protein